MQQNLKDILSQLPTDIDQEALLLYLQGKLPPEKQHELEKQMLENEFTADALEGLHHFGDKRQLAHIADELNKDLKIKTGSKKKRRIKSRIGAEPWLVVALVIILLLIIISYFIIYKHLHSN